MTVVIKPNERPTPSEIIATAIAQGNVAGERCLNTGLTLGPVQCREVIENDQDHSSIIASFAYRFQQTVKCHYAI